SSPGSTLTSLDTIDIDDGDIEAVTGEAVGYVQSRAFTRDYLKARPEVLRTLVSFLNASSRTDGGYAQATNLFEERVRHGFRDEDTGLFRVSAEWIDADKASAWANDMANFVNAQFLAKNLAFIARKISASRLELAQSSDQPSRVALAAALSREVTH